MLIDLEPVIGTVGVRQKYTLEGTSGHFRAPCRHINTITYSRGNLHSQSTSRHVIGRREANDGEKNYELQKILQLYTLYY